MTGATGDAMVPREDQRSLVAPVVVSAGAPERETIRCPNPKCNLTQYDTANRKCRKCKLSLHPEDDLPPKTVAPAPAIPTLIIPAEDALDQWPDLNKLPSDTPFRSLPSFWLPIVISYLREQSGLSQRDTARAMGVPRTYISKIETQGVCPEVQRLPRLAGALGVSEAHIVRMCEYLVLGR